MVEITHNKFKANPDVSFLKKDNDFYYVKLGEKVVILNEIAFFILSNIDCNTIDGVSSMLYDAINRTCDIEIIKNDCASCVKSLISEQLISKGD